MIPFRLNAFRPQAFISIQYLLSSCFRFTFGTYVSLLVRETHVCAPDLKAMAQLWEMHFLDFHPEFDLQTLDHLENIPRFQFPGNKNTLHGWKKRSVERWTHLPLNLHELSAHGIRHHRAAIMGDREEPQLLQVYLRVKWQPTEEITTKLNNACLTDGPVRHHHSNNFAQLNILMNNSTSNLFSIYIWSPSRFTDFRQRN